jgi:hypothetical protein
MFSSAQFLIAEHGGKIAAKIFDVFLESAPVSTSTTISGH